MSRFAFTTAAALAFAGPTTASAATIVHQFSYEASGVPGFDKTLGRLDQIDITATTYFELTFQVPANDKSYYHGYRGIIAEQAYRFYEPGNSNSANPAMYVYTGTTDSRDFKSADNYTADFVALTATRTVSIPRTSFPPDDDLIDRFVIDDVLSIMPNTYTRIDVTYSNNDQTQTKFEVVPTNRYITYLGTVTYTYSPLAAVPETATWALLIIGFGTIGAAMRRRAPAKVFA